MRVLKTLLAFFGFAAGMAVAQVPSVEEGRRPATDVAALLHLDADRAERVQAVFDGAREKARVAREQIGPATDETARVTLYAAMEAIRFDTEEKLAAILSGDELAKLHAAMPVRASRLEPMRFRRI